MDFKKKLETGKIIAGFDKNIKTLKIENKELKYQTKKYRATIMNLKKEINSLKTTIQMMQNEKNDKI